MKQVFSLLIWNLRFGDKQKGRNNIPAPFVSFRFEVYAMISSIPASSMLFATDGEIPESVMMTSTWSSVQIFPNPLFPNLEESARTIVRSEAEIIR